MQTRTLASSPYSSGLIKTQVKVPLTHLAKFEKSQSITVAGDGQEIVSVYLVDMNGDKLNDIVIVVRNSKDNTVSVMTALQKSDNTFPGENERDLTTRQPRWTHHDRQWNSRPIASCFLAV